MMYYYLQIMEVSEATSHARAGLNGTAKFQLVIGVSNNAIVLW